MITRIQIKNFQRHERLDIELDPVITVISGPTDTGKSSIIRALRWLCLNQPQGEDHIRDGAREAGVRAAVDGHAVIRKRTRGGANEYRLDGEEYRAFGADVPAPVAAMLNVDEINFQGQMDGPFWFDLSAGEVSRRLNAVVDLGVIDEALARTARGVSAAKAEADVAQRRLDAALAERDALAWVPRAEESWERVDALADDAVDASDAVDSLGVLVRRAASASQAAASAASAARAAGAVATAGERLRSLGGDVRALAASIRAAGREVVRPDFAAVRDAAARVRELAPGVSRLRFDLDAAIEAGIKVDQRRGRLAEAEEELAEMQAGVCPLCGRTG